MAKDKEQEYISALQDFSKSVEYLIIAIQNQVDSNENKFTDIVAASKDQAKDMAETARQVSVMSEKIKHTSNNTDEILKIVKGIKRKNQTGIWDKLNPKDKVNGVAEGISTIALMAGAVLAIGSAFKIVGDVDFSSVLALSIALPLMGIAFAKVNESIDSPKDAVNVAISMIAMSAGIAASGAVLSMMPSLSFMQMISVIAVSAALGVAMYGLAMAADEIGKGKIKNLYAIVPALPMVAAGIYASGLLLENMPIIGMEQFLSALGVGVALGAAMIPLAIASKQIGKPEDILKTIVMMPVMAAGIVASAYVLKQMPEVEWFNIMEATTAVTISTLIMGAGIMAITKMGLGLKDVAVGTLSMTIMSAGLVASSWILSLGNYTKYPSVEWSTGVGLAMLGYLPSVLVTGAIAATGVGALVIAAGIASMLGIAGGLVATAEIISKGNFTGGPSKQWAEGVGLSLMAFGNAMSVMSPGLLGMLMGDTLDQQIDSMVKLGGALVSVGAIVSNGKFTGGPSKEWSQGVGLSLMLFANALNAIKPNVFERLLGDTMDQNIEGLVKLGGALNRIGVAVGNDSSVYQGGPSKEWAQGVGITLSTFTKALQSMDSGWFSDSIDEQINNMVRLARAVPRIGNAIGSDTKMYQGGPSKEWADGVGTTIGAFAKAIAVLADEIDADEMDLWIPALRKLAPLIRMYGNELSQGKYDNYPSSDWSKGVLAFMDGFSNIGVESNVIAQAKGITVLSNSFFRLSKSIATLAYSLKKITKVPDMSGIYGGLVTLSLIDNKNLNAVLWSIDKKKDQFQKVLNMIKAESDVTVNDASFASKKDTKKETLGGNDKNSNKTYKSSNSNVNNTTAKVNKPKTEPKISKTEEILLQLLEQYTQSNDLLTEIAENTGSSGTGVKKIRKSQT